MACLARLVGLISVCWPSSLPLLQRTLASRLLRVRPAWLCFFMLLAAWTAGRSAAAQEIPQVSGPTCVPSSFNDCSGSTGSSGESDEERRERRAAAAEARAERKAERDAQNLAKRQAKEAAKRQAQQQIEDQKLAAIDYQRRQEEAKRQQEAEAERQRLAAIEAKRRQDAFNAMKPNLLSGLKDVDGNRPGAGNSLELKGVDDAPRGGNQAAWTATITDPQAASIARHLGSVVPPLPIPRKEVALDWKKVYLNEDRLMNTADLVIAAWEMTGVLGKPIAIPCKVLLIGGKTFIAGENGAYMHLVEKDKDYDAALAFLKNPAQSQQFARLVQDVRQNRPLPITADPAMVRAARAITDPKLGETGAVVWDAMTSKEALSAMLRKAAIEVGTEMLSPSTGGLLHDEAERKAIFDSVRLQRTRARKMMDLAATSDAQRAQFKTVIEHADQLSADLYKVEKVNDLASGVADERISKAWGEASDELATSILGTEAKGREY